jgi:hypothetical protein
MEVPKNNAVALREPKECIVVLVSKDGKKFRIPLFVITGKNGSAFLRQFIEKMGYDIEDMHYDVEDWFNDDIGPIPLPDIMSDILEPCLSFLEHHKNDEDMTEEEQEKWKSSLITGWDARFADMKTPDGKVDIGKMYKLILAANSLGFKLLLDTMCKAVTQLVCFEEKQMSCCFLTQCVRQ